MVGFLKKINKKDRSLAILTRKKKTLKSIKAEIKEKSLQHGTTEMQRIIRKHYEHLYANELDNLK
jgi:hypothetical protein